ncbi:MAG: hypothetical protein V4627_03270 [Pseudomonadota bacterium]
MKVWKQWALRLSVAATVVLGLCVLALAWWLPSGEELAQRLTTVVNDKLGIPVSIGAVHWSLLPTPAITIHDLRTQQAQPVVIGSLRAYPKLHMLLQRKLVLRHIDVMDATIPRNSLHALKGKPGAMPEQPEDGVLLEHLAFRNLTWISYSGIATTFDGEIDFDPLWRPRHAALRRPGHTPPFTLTATREAEADRWQIRTVVGGGTAHGHVELKTDKDDAATLHLRGQLAPRGIEVASALATFNRRSPVAGQASGPTELWAEGKSLGQLTRSLHTQTRFTVNPATVLRFDLDKAIRTRGKEHDGQTALQELTGQLDTQNGAEGMRVTVTDIRARAGKFTATGKAMVYHGQIEASGNLDLVEGALGVPITLSGPVQKPKVTVPPGFYAGAAIGTVLLPGIGTAIGARIGGAMGEVFSGDGKKTATK